MPNEKSNSLIYPEQCSKFEHCSASLCPMDEQRAKRVIHRDDPVCFYLSEVAKPGAKERISMGHSKAMYEVASRVYLELANTTCPIKKSLERAKSTPSRIREVGATSIRLGAAL
jgi:hypothetical protein